jgi:hypothetical protein
VEKLLIALYVIVAVGAGALILAVVLVSVASRREDSAASLAGPAPGPVQAWARRILGFRCEGITWPRPEGRAHESADVLEDDAVPGSSRAEAPTLSLASRRRMADLPGLAGK